MADVSSIFVINVFLSIEMKDDDNDEEDPGSSGTEIEASVVLALGFSERIKKEAVLFVT